MSARLDTFYRETVVPNLIKKFSYGNPMQVPRLVKITLNMGVGEAVGNKKILENALDDMTKIAGQKPVTTLAKKSIATFKIRDGWPIGCKVTLRRAQMFEFLDRLVTFKQGMIVGDVSLRGDASERTMDVPPELTPALAEDPT